MRYLLNKGINKIGGLSAQSAPVVSNDQTTIYGATYTAIYSVDTVTGVVNWIAVYKMCGTFGDGTLSVPLATQHPLVAQ